MGRLNAALIVSLFLFDVVLSSSLIVQAAEQSPPFKPPWEHPTMRDIAGGSFVRKTPLPPEVEEKKSETPVTSCTRKYEWELDLPSTDLKSLSVTEFTYADGTRVAYRYYDYRSMTGGANERRTDYWEVVTPSGTTTRYHPNSIGVSESSAQQLKYMGVEPGGPYAIVREPGQPVHLRKWDRPSPAAGQTPTAPQKPPPTSQPTQTPSVPPTSPQERGSSISPLFSGRLANVSYGGSRLDSVAMVENRSSDSAAVLLAAATQERPPTQTRETQEEPQHNIKIVAIGGPLSDPVVVMYEPEPQTTPEDFVNKPPMASWDPNRDPQGPSTATPGPDGIPITGIPVGFINIGSGWASQRVHSSGLLLCSDGPPSGITTESRQDRAQANLPDGGEVVVAPHYGWIYLPDGTHVDRWKNGAKTISRRNGFEMTYFPESGWAFTLPDRTEVTINNKGTTVRLPDGKTITRRRDGKVVEERPDGTEAPFTGGTGDIKLPGGATLDMSSGYTAIIKTPDGTEIRTLHGEGGSLTQVTSQDGSQITASNAGEIILNRPGHPGIKMEKDGETIIFPGGREPTVRLKTNGMVDVVPFGGRIY